MHNNGAPKMRATGNWTHQGALLRTNPRCGTCWGVLQAEGRGRVGQGQGDEGGRGDGVQLSKQVEEAGGSWEAMLLAALL